MTRIIAAAVVALVVLRPRLGTFFLQITKELASSKFLRNRDIRAGKDIRPKWALFSMFVLPLFGAALLFLGHFDLNVSHQLATDFTGPLLIIAAFFAFFVSYGHGAAKLILKTLFVTQLPKNFAPINRAPSPDNFYPTDDRPPRKDSDS